MKVAPEQQEIKQEERDRVEEERANETDRQPEESRDGQSADEVDQPDTHVQNEINAEAVQEESAVNPTEALEKLAEENEQRLLRLQADFDNFRKRTRLEKEEFAKYASQKLLEQLLPIIDNFERAISSSKENRNFESFAQGVDMIFRQFVQVLEQENVTPIPAVGEPFNPEFHQAVMQVESDEYEEGIIVEEMQKGYMLKDKVLRPSMVTVSK